MEKKVLTTPKNMEKLNISISSTFFINFYSFNKISGKNRDLT